jgi:hypothetical protein
MSTDRWSICPKCYPGEKDNGEENIEYMLREDWNIGTNLDGIFTVNYSCWCSACGFKFNYKFVKQILEDDPRKLINIFKKEAEINKTK